MGASSTATLTSLKIGVLGPVRAERDGAGIDLGGPKQRAVLAMLVAGHGHAVSRGQVIEGVWGESASEANRRSFHTYVSNLRSSLGDVIARAGETYRLSVDPASIDSERFEAVVAEARTRLTTDPGLTAVSLREALATWQGRPYADLVDVPGLDAEVRRLEELRLEAVELRIDAELASGLHGSLVSELEALAEEHPTRERFRAQHMLALYRSGRQSEALRAFRRTESFLADELGVEPSDELRNLELKILQHDESLLGGPGRAVTQRLAFVATDIEGSTRLWDTHAQEMAEILATHDRILREAVEIQNGRVFRHTGHGVLAALPSAVAAVDAAEAALVALAAADWGVIDELRVRVGIDVGEAEARGGDFFGPPLNRAARLCSAGHGGQVLISEAVQAEVVASARPGVQFRQLGEHRLRGAVAPERIAQLVLAGLPDEFPELRLGDDALLRDDLGPISLPGYEVRAPMGEGALGVVWRAYQPSVGREVALKIIRPELASQPSFVRRFEAEARTIARLGHPHIVPLVDFWRDSDSAFLVMALMAGGSLEEALESGSIGSAQARKVLAQIGSAIDYAHSQGIVHGDLRPGNVLLDASGNAYLSDFWIGSPALYEMTSSAASFQAPEIERTGPTAEADRYAFAALVDQLLGGGPELTTVLTRGKAAIPEDRFPSCSSLLLEIDRALGETPELTADVVTRNPYKGLRAFGVEDSGDFHGRDDLVVALLGAVSDGRFVAVVGPSGSGKSSVVMAGLVPAISQGRLEDSEDWGIAVMTPGVSPVEALAEALRPVASDPVDLDRLLGWGLDSVFEGELLLVVDQFEELYTVADEEQRLKFLDLIVDAVEEPRSSTRVVATLRADFYDRPLGDSRLGRMVKDGLLTVLPPSGDELLEMIVAPARGVGLRFETGLPHRIIEDVAGQPGGLPLLQYALTEMVERRSGDVVTAADYEKVGGVDAALATRAEALFRDLTEGQQELTRQVFLRMVTVGEDSEETRRRARRAELESLGHNRADLDAVLGTLIDERLLISDRDPKTRGPTVEIAHEALLREWPRLAEWVEDERDALIVGRRFRRALADWEAGERHDDYLLTGTRLVPYVSWAESTMLTPDEGRFYQASLDRDRAERTARTRRRRLLTGALAGGAIVAGIFGAVAMVQASRANAGAEAAADSLAQALAAEALAEEQAERAEQQAELARQREQEALAALLRGRASELSAFATAALATDPGLAKLLAVASVLTDEPSLETLSILHRSLEADPTVGRYGWPEEVEVASLWTDLHPVGTRLVAGGACCLPSPRLEVFDFLENRILWAFETAEPSIGIDRPQFTPDGTRVVAGLFWWDDKGGQPPEDGLGVRIWDAESGVEETRLDLGVCGAWVLDVSSTHLLTVTLNGEDPRCFAQFTEDNQVGLELVEILTGNRTVLTSTYSDGGVFSSDGRRVAYTDEAESVTVVVDVDSGERLLQLDITSDLGPSFRVPMDLNRDGSLLLVSDRPIEVWDVEERERIARFDEHAGGANAIFSPADDGTVLSVGQSAILRHWDAETGEEIDSFPAVHGYFLSASNGGVLVPDVNARGAVLMDVKIRGEVLSIPSEIGGFFPNPLRVVGDKAVFIRVVSQTRVESIVVDLDRKEWVQIVPGQNGQGLAVSPDGTRFARQDANAPTENGEPGGGNWLGPVRIRDIETGDVLVELKGLCTFDQNGERPYWTQPGCGPLPDGPVPTWMAHLEWSPDGRFVAGTPAQATVAFVWDAESGDLILTVDDCHGSYSEHVFFTPESDQLVVFCSGRLRAFDTTSWSELRSSHAPGERGDFGSLWFVGFDDDNSHLIGVGSSSGAGWSLVRVDPDTLQYDVIGRIVEGQPKSWALSPDRKRAAIGSADGLVKVWDLDSRSVVHEINLGNTQANGVAFLNDAHLMVLSEEGDLRVYTLDHDELVALVRRSLTRGFTPFECERYGFGDDCPTLEELRGEESAS